MAASSSSKMCIRDRGDAALGGAKLCAGLGQAGLFQAVLIDMVGHGAVSYTHLDVYKRQLLQRVGIKEVGKKWQAKTSPRSMCIRDSPTVNVQWPECGCEHKTSAKDQLHEPFAAQKFEFFEKW